jgi:hypothetical protein
VPQNLHTNSGRRGAHWSIKKSIKLFKLPGLPLPSHIFTKTMDVFRTQYDQKLKALRGVCAKKLYLTDSEPIYRVSQLWFTGGDVRTETARRTVNAIMQASKALDKLSGDDGGVDVSTADNEDTSGDGSDVASNGSDDVVTGKSQAGFLFIRVVEHLRERASGLLQYMVAQKLMKPALASALLDPIVEDLTIWIGATGIILCFVSVCMSGCLSVCLSIGMFI